MDCVLHHPDVPVPGQGDTARFADVNLLFSPADEAPGDEHLYIAAVNLSEEGSEALDSLTLPVGLDGSACAAADDLDGRLG